MKNEKTKIIINILLFTILIIELIPTKIIPVYAHYIFGLLFAFLLLIHIYLNRKWCVLMTKALISGKPNQKAKRQYRTDLLLLILCIFVIISGFPTMGYAMGAGRELIIFKFIHVILSRITVLVTLIHLYQHKGQIRSYFKRISGKTLKQRDNQDVK
jgi:hypothetical protein